MYLLCSMQDASIQKVNIPAKNRNPGIVLKGRLKVVHAGNIQTNLFWLLNIWPVLQVCPLTYIACIQDSFGTIVSTQHSLLRLALQAAKKCVQHMPGYDSHLSHNETSYPMCWPQPLLVLGGFLFLQYFCTGIRVGIRQAFRWKVWLSSTLSSIWGHRVPDIE